LDVKHAGSSGKQTSQLLTPDLNFVQRTGIQMEW